FFFAVICTFVAVYSSRSHVDVTPDRSSSSSTSNFTEVCTWVIFAACSSALLLAVTNDLCQGIAPIPLLWIAPLAVYLITFVICFDYGAIVRPTVYAVLVPAALIGLVAVHANPNLSIRLAVPLCLVSLFVACMFCHGQLYDRKPESGSLTRFYLAISLGGAIGSVFVGLVAPSLFSDYFELPVAVTACLLLALKFIFGYRARAFLVTCAVIALALLRIFGTFSDDGAITVQVRNFYGAMAVRESTRNVGIVRTLSHGGTVHGGQIVAKNQLKEPTAYYGRESGVAVALQRSAGKQRVGVVGLGVGTVAAYGHAGDSYRFYEINPLVQELANTHFTYLRDSGAAIKVVLGDGRLSLASERDQHFDTLILDAFSGDSVPFHLLTREAFQLYFRHVKPDGVIAVHISNRYLDLSSVIARNAATLGRLAVRIISAPHPERAILTADWILVAADGDFLKQQVQQNIGTRLLPGTGRPWTDQYSNILSALR
ncbi:MAG TPA: fused MFS/spermidine synthase, partial [Tepidisphaeraceae bacterium]|nr:fused MFS/spermidine synthase [Tepidisphaeraceae bacterium]